ncbi:MAG: rod-binding protein [Rhizorhabdus sp.]
MQAVAKQFEAVFLRQMIGSMRQADLAEGVFDSSATGQFRDMADSKTADSMAETGSFGIASMMMRQFDAQHKIVTPPAVDSGK